LRRPPPQTWAQNSRSCLDPQPAATAVHRAVSRRKVLSERSFAQRGRTARSVSDRPNSVEPTERLRTGLRQPDTFKRRHLQTQTPRPTERRSRTCLEPGRLADRLPCVPAAVVPAVRVRSAAAAPAGGPVFSATGSIPTLGLSASRPSSPPELLAAPRPARGAGPCNSSEKKPRRCVKNPGVVGGRDTRQRPKSSKEGNQ